MLAKAQPRSKVQVEFVHVTPEIAASWLDKNVHNRSVSHAVVSKYARDIASGAWRMTGDPIKFDTQGNLLDGQHRLRACMQAGVGFETAVIYGLDPIAQDVMDSGKSRSAADVLTLRGLFNSKRTVTAVRAMITYKAGGNRQAMISTSEIVAALERHPNITKSVTLVNNLPRAIPLGPLAFTHYVGTHLMKLPETANAFMDVFRTGVPEFDGDPSHMLRERFIRSIADPHRIRGDVAAWTLYYTWNLFCERQSLQQLKWAKDPVRIARLKDDKL